MVVSITDSGPVSSASGHTNEDASTLVTATTTVDGGDSGDSVNLATGYVLSSSTSTHGASVSYNNNGTFTYNPSGAASSRRSGNGTPATDTFTYTVTDNHGVSAIATGTVVVSITDSGPVSSASGATNEDASTLVTATPPSRRGQRQFRQAGRLLVNLHPWRQRQLQQQRHLHL